MKNIAVELLIMFVLLVILISCSEYSDEQLMQYQNPVGAGFSTVKLEEVRDLFIESDGAALLLFYKGNVLLSEGETTRKFRCASVRKSLLNSVFGIAVDKGEINLNSTLGELGIDDEPKLTETEKTATVKDLLSARSGVYHMASYMPRGMGDRMPERGSHKPGTHWFYNNWDFNTLVTIYNQQTGRDFFEDFNSKIAQPIGMKDFTLEDTFYRYEEDKSIHPAYLFRMSARDLALFGQLYLNKGEWNGEQIIPSEWIETSTTPHTKALGSFENKGDYGYLWWIADDLIGQPAYYASGSGGQRVIVLPEEDIVIAHLVNTYDNNDVNDHQIFELTKAIINAKERKAVSDPALVEYTPPKIELPEFVDLDESFLNKYEGTYNHRFLGEISFSQKEGQMYMHLGIGNFKIYPTSENTFYPEDIQTPLEFIEAEDESKRNTAGTVFNDKKKIEKVVFYY